VPIFFTLAHLISSFIALQRRRLLGA
jgi:hypothetical protein